MLMDCLTKWENGINVLFSEFGYEKNSSLKQHE